MTLDDLVAVYGTAAGDVAVLRQCVADRRAGIRAVVEALRDGMVPLIGTYAWDDVDAEKWFNDILASEGEVKAAGGEDCPEDRSPAADVCEWTMDGGTSSFDARCGGKWMQVSSGTTPREEGYWFCPTCGKLISFKGTP
jgi:hypothetical protein